MTVLYCLVDPREPERVRYIGISKDAHERYCQHLDEATSRRVCNYKSNWLWSLLVAGRGVKLRILAELADHEAPRIEQLAIAGYRKSGHPLTNLTTGGDGLFHPPEVNAKKAAANTRRWSDPANRERQSGRAKALWRDPTYRARMLEGLNRPVTDEQRAAMSERSKAMWRDPDYRARQVTPGTVWDDIPDARARHDVARARPAARGTRQARHTTKRLKGFDIAAFRAGEDA